VEGDPPVEKQKQKLYEAFQPDYRERPSEAGGRGEAFLVHEPPARPEIHLQPTARVRPRRTCLPGNWATAPRWLRRPGASRVGWPRPPAPRPARPLPPRTYPDLPQFSDNTLLIPMKTTRIMACGCWLLALTTLEADGVAFAAIQGLNQKMEATRAENAALKH